MRQWIQQFSAIERYAWGLFLRTSVLWPLISSSLRLRGFRQTKSTLQYFVSALHGLQDPSAQERAALTEGAMRAVWRPGIGHPACRNVSFTLWWLLARQGIASDLSVAAHKDGGTIEAHARVECEGVAFTDPEMKVPHFAACDAALASFAAEQK